MRNPEWLQHTAVLSALAAASIVIMGRDRYEQRQSQFRSTARPVERR